MKFSSLFLLLVVSFFVPEISAQRISSGINVHTPLVAAVHFKQNYYNPINTVRVYFVNEPQSEKERYFRISPLGLNTKYYKSFGIGAGYVLKIDYKRYILRIGYQASYNSATLRFNHFDSGGEIDDYKVLFNIQNFQHRIPVIFSYNLKRSETSPLIYLGAEYGRMFYAREKIDWEYAGNYERQYVRFMYGHYYNRDPWFNAVVGAGKKRKKMEWALLLKYRIDEGKNDLTIDNYQLEFNFNFFITYQSLKRNHFIYIDDEE